MKGVCVCAGGGAKAGQGPPALTKEPLQCLNGLPRHEHGGGVLNMSTQIKMVRRGLPSEAALCRFGNLPSLWVSEIS